MAEVSSTTAEQAPSTWQRMIVVAALLLAVIVVFLLAFALPTIHSEAKDVPVAIVAPEPVAAAISGALDQAGPGAFDLTVAADADEARELILDRAVYGAFLVTDSRLTVTTASAASFAVAQTLTATGQQLAQASALEFVVDDLVPFPEADPRGAGLPAGALPIALGGWIAAVGILRAVHGNRQRLVTAAAFAVLGGFGLTAVLRFWLGTLAGSYWLVSLGAVLGIAATSFLVLGFQQFLKVRGIVIAAVILILLGNPLSGLGSAPEMLPRPWGAIGQLLPPGATGTLLRNLAFFDGAATTRPILVLSLWFLAGVGMYLLAQRRTGRPDVEVSEVEPASDG